MGKGSNTLKATPSQMGTGVWGFPMPLLSSSTGGLTQFRGQWVLDTGDLDVTHDPLFSKLTNDPLGRRNHDRNRGC